MMKARLALTCALLSASTAYAAEITVVTSGAFAPAYRELVPDIERSTRHKVVSAFGPSMGTAPDAIPQRLDRGEAIDVVIMAAPALAALVDQRKIRPGSPVELAQSSIGMCIKSGATVPDISTVDALKRTLLAAKSIAYSSSASGVYLSNELFLKLGIAGEIKSKTRRIEGEPVGEAVARGDAEVGFQQISELLPVEGIVIVGPLPRGAQRVTIFAAGIPTASKHPEAARALIEFLASPAAAPAIRKSGLEPVKPK